MNRDERLSNCIDYVEIPVVDVQAAKRFYGDVFGWEFVDYGPDYASFNDGRLDGGLRKDVVGGQGGPLVVFYDANLENKEAKIKSSAGKIVKEIFEFPGGRRFHFLDPDGNEFAVWSDK
jgi:predicted enzyme related to lactoylglutathione lyase